MSICSILRQAQARSRALTCTRGLFLAYTHARKHKRMHRIPRIKMGQTLMLRRIIRKSIGRAQTQVFYIYLSYFLRTTDI